jgi:hypothetical protein
MLGEEKRLQTLELVHTLYELAVNLGMKLRITDSIRECEEALQGDVSENEWVQIEVRLGEILDYMEKEILGEKNSVIVNGEQMVSKEDVQKRILEIWNAGKEEQNQIVSGYRANSMNILYNLKNNMRDFSNANANYHILSVPDQFAARCTQLAQKYDQDIQGLSGECLDEICGQYAQAMNRIRGLISSIDHRQVGITSKDIYENWDNCQESCRQNIKKTLAGIDTGKQLLVNFGNEQIAPLETIQKKNRKKRRRFIWMPIYVVLIVLIVILGAKLVPEILEAVSVGNQVSKEMESSTENDLTDLAIKLGDIAVDSMEDNAIDSVMGGNSIFDLDWKSAISIAILIIVGFILWVHYTGRLYRKWMIEDLGNYLTPKLSVFCQDNAMENAIGSYFQSLYENTGAGYENLFGSLFGNSFSENLEHSPAETVRKARAAWNQIRYVR